MLRIVLGFLGVVGLPLAKAVTWDVAVGGTGLRFSPETVNAESGDVINFIFHPQAHSVTQSSFSSPCAPVDNGFDSGIKPVASDASDLPNYQLTVNDTSAPLWVYCKQQGHCGAGMVFAVNPPTSGDNTFGAFQALANGTATAGSSSASASLPSSASSSASSYVTPPAPSVVTVTATVTGPSSTWTTTYGSYEGSSPPTPAAQPADHKVLVGDGGSLSFSPTNISAFIGDTVTFEFRAKNHTATRSSFLAPCQPLLDTSAGATNFFDSGFVPIANGSTSFQTFQITVNDTAPIWVYCKQGNHCGAGMVFSVNAIESGPNNFAAFQAQAKHVNGTTTSPSGSGSPSGTTASSSSPSSTGTNSNSAFSMSAQGSATSLLAVVALVFAATL